MLSINNFSLLRNTNYRTPNRQTLFNSFPKLNATKLAPLAKDIVTFTQRYTLDDIVEDKICKKIHENASEAQNTMERLIQSYFNDLIYDANNNQNGIINPIDARVKTPESIKEKVTSRFIKTLKQKGKDGGYSLDDVFSPYDENAIKNNLRDISGTQITVRSADKESTDRIIDALCKMIRDNNLIVDEVQNHIPGDNESASYFSEEQLEKLRTTINAQREKNQLAPIDKIKPEPKESGYTGLHITFDTTTFGTYKQNHGYFHELQIIGADVEILKDVENFCYKLKKGYDIMQKHYAYEPFVQYFMTYYPHKDDCSPKAEALRTAYLEYTQKAYEIQRNRKPNHNIAQDDVTNWAYRYPTIEQCGLKDKIPVELDFNNLARIKRDCDDIYKVSKYAGEILNGREQEIDKEEKITYRSKAV